jgi:hypothetical protein
MKVQSEHWSSNQCTLFVMVWQWLDVVTWNKEEGRLRSGDEVTVNGEKAGEARSAGSFWAKVVSGPERAAGSAADTYVVEDAAGASHTVARGELRQRVFVKQAHAGVSGDKKHDRYFTPPPPSFLQLSFGCALVLMFLSSL